MEESLEEALRLKAKELRDTLMELKKKDFDVNVNKLRMNLRQQKRCNICTLKVPCKHYKSIKEVPRCSKENLLDDKILNTTEEFIDFSKFVPNFPTTKKVSFSVTHRGRERRYYIDPNFRDNSLPNEKRFNLLCSIEAYREEKLQEELKKLEQAKEEEEKLVREKNCVEEEKKKYMVKQKEKIKRYKVEADSKREQIEKIIETENLKRRIKENRMKAYYENKKKLLKDYQEQKKNDGKIPESSVDEINMLSMSL